MSDPVVLSSQAWDLMWRIVARQIDAERAGQTELARRYERAQLRATDRWGRRKARVALLLEVKP